MKEIRRIPFFLVFCCSFFLIAVCSVFSQTLPKVCAVRGVLGSAPAGGSTGTMSNTIWRPGSATATCSGVTSPNPFNSGAGSFRYNVHYLNNPSIFPICVPVRLTKTNPSISGADLQVSVFQSPFSAGDITNSVRFRGDAGTSTGAFAVWQPTSFNVVVPATSSVALVVYNTVNNSTAAEPYQLDFCTTTTSYSGGGIAVPDNNPTGINVPLNVSTSGRISDLNVRFFTFSSGCDATPGNAQAAVSHTFVGDLVFRLVAPNGLGTTFWDRRGGTRENICSTLIDDEGNLPALSTITNTTGQFVSGSFSPETTGRLSRFDSENAQGTWTLNVSDNADGDTGTFRRFALEITTIPRNAPYDYDGDGRTDLSIFRPNAGEWWVSKSSNGGNFAVQFGSSTDRIAPGDYTGDGISDIGFWRPSTGEWYILRSEDFSFFAFPFGANGDVPVPGDFDGDTFTDAAVYRPSTATWFINRSGGGIDIIGFGAAGDKPVPADYDGDGKADIMIFRPNGASGGGEWWGIRSRSGANLVFLFGAPADKAVPGDYTGDGRADIAVWRPSSGSWFVLRSDDLSFYSVPFGANGDVPVPGDYDADGKFDTAVFRPSNSTWFVQRSNAGTLIQSFGVAGDFPTPNSYVP